MKLVLKMSFTRTIRLHTIAVFLFFAILQLCQVSFATEGRILPGQGNKQDSEVIPISNSYNNDPQSSVGEVLLNENKSFEVPGEISSVIQQILQDRYLRSPVAIVVDVASPFLYRAKKLLESVASTNTGKNLVLIPYNSTDIGKVQKPMNIIQLQNAIHNLKFIGVAQPNMGGVAFYSMLKATEQVPYDSAILLFTGRTAADEDLAQLTTQSLILKRCKLHVIWCGPAPMQNNGIEALYREVAMKTGGGFYQSNEDDHTPVNNGDTSSLWPTKDGQLIIPEPIEITLAMRLGMTGSVRLPFQVDKTVTSIFIIIQGPVNSAILEDTRGNAIDLTKDEEVKRSPLKSTVLVREYNLSSVRLNTSVAAPGVWILTTAGAGSNSRYNVIVKGISSLYFNATTRDISSTHHDVTKHKDITNHNIQYTLGIPDSIAYIQNVSLVNKEGDKLSLLQYNPGNELLPAINIPVQKLSNEPLYLQLSASTVAGDVIQRLVEVKQQTTASNAVAYTVELLPKSNIVVQPGERLILVFNVTNHNFEPTRLAFTCQTREQQQSLQPIFIKPLWADILPRNSIEVEVTTIVFGNVPHGTTVTVAFTARPYWVSFPTITRAVSVYVGGIDVTDTDRPTINYSVKKNCKNVPQESCSTAAWNMEATIQDSRAGLISVISNPIGIKFQNNFIAGTKIAVPVIYSASCCAPTLDIKATDAKGNYITQHIDANADNEGLSDAEIAAIVLGVLLLLIVIVAIVLAIFLCKRRQSRNLQQSSR